MISQSFGEYFKVTVNSSVHLDKKHLLNCNSLITGDSGALLSAQIKSNPKCLDEISQSTLDCILGA